MMNVKDLPYLPKPRITRCNSVFPCRPCKWCCHSEERYTWDGLHGFYCSGLGMTPEEAYAEWLESYVSDRYLKDEDDK